MRLPLSSLANPKSDSFSTALCKNSAVHSKVGYNKGWYKEKRKRKKRLMFTKSDIMKCHINYNVTEHALITIKNKKKELYFKVRNGSW